MLKKYALTLRENQESMIKCSKKYAPINMV